jgi:predicted transglutaminase-like cysteine proteinase
MNNWVAKLRQAARLVSSAAIAALLLSPALASPLPPASFEPVSDVTRVPFGWADFCRRYQGECDGGPVQPVDIVAAAKTMKELVRVNKWVNSHIQPMTDLEHQGVISQWDYPTDGKGDCDEFALLKRKILLEEGFPRQALLMTIVKAGDEGHAILTVTTTAGDYILDNLTDEMKLWDRTGYRFVKRQAQSDQNVWLQIGEPTSAPEYTSRP